MREEDTWHGICSAAEGDGPEMGLAAPLVRGRGTPLTARLERSLRVGPSVTVLGGRRWLCHLHVHRAETSGGRLL